MDFDSIGRRHIPEPDLVPILDALTCVIFFMLLSATFMSLTKLTVPPSMVAETPATSGVPLNPVLVVKESGSELSLRLSWQGDAPGELVRKISRMMPRNLELLSKTQELVAEFSQKYQQQKTMQISLSSQMQYQELITVMDGVRERYQDIVLVSPDLANVASEVQKK